MEIYNILSSNHCDTEVIFAVFPVNNGYDVKLVN